MQAPLHPPPHFWPGCAVALWFPNWRVKPPQGQRVQTENSTTFNRSPPQSLTLEESGERWNELKWSFHTWEKNGNVIGWAWQSCIDTENCPNCNFSVTFFLPKPFLRAFTSAPTATPITINTIVQVCPRKFGWKNVENLQQMRIRNKQEIQQSEGVTTMNTSYESNGKSAYMIYFSACTFAGMR